MHYTAKIIPIADQPKGILLPFNPPGPLTAVQSIIETYQQADKKARVQQAKSLDGQSLDMSAEQQMLYWMEMHSEAKKSKVLRRLAETKVKTLITDALEQDATPSYKPMQALNTILLNGVNDVLAETHPSITNKTLMMAARQGINAIGEKPDAAAKHYNLFTDGTQTIFKTFLSHGGLNTQGQQNKNTLNAQLILYFSTAEKTAAHFNPDESKTLDALIPLAQEVEKKKNLKNKINPLFFMRNYIKDIVNSKVPTLNQTNYHISNMFNVNVMPTQTGKPQLTYMTKFKKDLAAELARDGEAKKTPTRLQAEVTEKVLDSYGKAAAIGLHDYSEKTTLSTSKTLNVLQKTFKLTSAALLRTSRDDIFKAGLSNQAFYLMGDVVEKVAPAALPPQTKAMQQLHKLRQNITDMSTSIYNTVAATYNLATADKMKSVSEEKIFSEFPTVIYDKKPSLLQRIFKFA